MKRVTLKRCSLILAAALAVCGSSAALAATLTQNITLTGSILPAPASCSFQGPTVVTINLSVYQSMQPFAPSDMSVQCASGISYTISGGTQWNPIMINGHAAGLQLLRASDYRTIHGAGITGVGTGALQTIGLTGLVGGANPYSNFDQTKHIGSISGTVVLTMAY